MEFSVGKTVLQEISATFAFGFTSNPHYEANHKQNFA